ncbi:hypothetical protein B0T17DRAFT_508711 [Bombardia bombarda]|uniref:FYVE-type domain-containing protein n=1 Tax=Bombardia bombarda TaxID=252184 RepID=A0AA39WTM6_9PEZI|nr:hypothetical protein B0T17DRAFT_508711 [Bombardia bombarda]
MATDFVMPRLPDHQQHNHYQQQPPFQQVSPIPTPYSPSTTQTPQISPLSTSSNSPTSPKSYITRQIRPLYMPAVLRPTEFPSKASSRAKTEDVEEPAERALRPNSSFISLSGLSALGRLSRRSTGDSGKCMDGNWNLDLFPKPTGGPSRRHWKPDQESSVCDHATCKKSFNYFSRRHHCRKCGNIFCDFHSAYEIPLDQDANYNPHSPPSRACAHCFSEFKDWRSRTNSQSSSVISSDGSDTPRSPAIASPTSAASASTPGPHMPEVAHSVPRDWNWSTF